MRVIDCDGSAQSSAVIAGLDWLAQNYQLPAVASMSLGSDSPNQALDDAVTAIIDLGITAVIAAGNYNQGQQHCMGSLTMQAAAISALNDMCRSCIVACRLVHSVGSVIEPQQYAAKASVLLMSVFVCAQMPVS